MIWNRTSALQPRLPGTTIVNNRDRRPPTDPAMSDPKIYLGDSLDRGCPSVALISPRTPSVRKEYTTIELQK